MPIRTAYNSTFRRQNKTLVPATFKKGVISSINQIGGANGVSANVIIVGNMQTVLKNVRFSSSIIAANVRPGDKCRIDLFSEANPNDMIISYVYH